MKTSAQGARRAWCWGVTGEPRPWTSAAVSTSCKARLHVIERISFLYILDIGNPTNRGSLHANSIPCSLRELNSHRHPASGNSELLSHLPYDRPKCRTFTWLLQSQSQLWGYQFNKYSILPPLVLGTGATAVKKIDRNPPSLSLHHGVVCTLVLRSGEPLPGRSTHGAVTVLRNTRR